MSPGRGRGPSGPGAAGIARGGFLLRDLRGGGLFLSPRGVLQALAQHIGPKGYLGPCAGLGHPLLPRTQAPPDVSPGHKQERSWERGGEETGPEPGCEASGTGGAETPPSALGPAWLPGFLVPSQTWTLNPGIAMRLPLSGRSHAGPRVGAQRGCRPHGAPCAVAGELSAAGTGQAGRTRALRSPGRPGREQHTRAELVCFGWLSSFISYKRKWRRMGERETQREREKPGGHARPLSFSLLRALSPESDPQADAVLGSVVLTPGAGQVGSAGPALLAHCPCLPALSGPRQLQPTGRRRRPVPPATTWPLPFPRVISVPGSAPPRPWGTRTETYK